MFSAIFTKGDNFFDFPFASLIMKHFQTGVSSQRKEFAPLGANSFLSDFTPLEKKIRKKMMESITLKVNL